MDSSVSATPKILCGSWDLRRTVISQKGLIATKMHGRAEFIAHSKNALGYQEHVVHKTGRGDLGAYQVYRYVFEDTTLFIYFGPPREDELFVTIDLMTGNSKSYLCGKDCYQFEMQELKSCTIRYRITIHGPKKDQVIETQLEKLPQPLQAPPNAHAL